MSFVPPSLKNEIKKTFNSIKNELNKSICVYSQPTTADCPNCLHDHTGASVNKFDTNFVTPVTIFNRLITPTSFTRGRCPVCYGKGRLESENKSIIKVLVRWNPTGVIPRGNMEKTPGGIEGNNVVLIKTTRCNYELLRDCLKSVIDGVECTLFLPPVIRGVGDIDVVVEAYFVAIGVGSSVRED